MSKTKLYTELESGVPGEYVVDYSQVKNAPNSYTKKEIDTIVGNINTILESIING